MKPQVFDKEAVKARLDIGELMGLAQGKSSGLVRCPFGFHEDRTPSCSVDRSRGLFNCHSCGCKGDIFDYFGFQEFGRSYSKASNFRTALELAASAAGIGPSMQPARKRAPKSLIGATVAAYQKRQSEAASRPQIAEELEALQAKYSSSIPQDALDYWSSRGFDIELSKSLGMGYRADWHGANRITFPLTLPDGEIRQFAGRAIPPHSERAPKVCKSSRDELKLEGDDRIGGWFNAPAVLTERELYICEGIPDALALIQSGYPGAFALAGLHAGSYDPALFTRLGPLPRPVYVCFDADTSGHDRALTFKDELERQFMGLLTVQVLKPPEGCKDFAEALERGIPIELPKREGYQNIPLPSKPLSTESVESQFSASQAKTDPFSTVTPIEPPLVGDPPSMAQTGANTADIYRASPLYRKVDEMYSLACDERDKAAEGSDRHRAAAELALLFREWDDEFFKGKGDDWKRTNGARVNELVGVIYEGKPYEPMFDGEALKRVCLDVFEGMIESVNTEKRKSVNQEL